MATALKTFLLDKLLRFISPDSFAPELAKVQVKEFEKSDSLLRLIEPGDIIFHSTSSTAYELIRMFANMEYDHVSVALNKKEAIQISPPVISRIPLRYLLLARQRPLVLRLKKPKEDIEAFLNELHQFLGEKYSYERALTMAMGFLGKGKAPTTFQLAELKEHKICSNVVLYCLCRAFPDIHELIKDSWESTSYGKLGDFLPDNVKDLLVRGKNVEVIHRQQLEGSKIDGELFKSILKIVFSKGSYTHKAEQLLKIFSEINIEKHQALRLVFLILRVIKPLTRFMPFGWIMKILRMALTMAVTRFQHPKPIVVVSQNKKPKAKL